MRKNTFEMLLHFRDLASTERIVPFKASAFRQQGERPIFLGKIRKFPDVFLVDEGLQDGSAQFHRLRDNPLIGQDQQLQTVQGIAVMGQRPLIEIHEE